MVLEFLSFFCHIAVASLLYTLSLHDALPISCRLRWHIYSQRRRSVFFRLCGYRICSIGRSSRLMATRGRPRSEEHTSELQSLRHLVCRLLLEKKKIDQILVLGFAELMSLLRF